MNCPFVNKKSEIKFHIKVFKNHLCGVVYTIVKSSVFSLYKLTIPSPCMRIYVYVFVV